MKTYEIYINGIAHTVQLTDEDAEAQGLNPLEQKSAPAPKNKARGAITKES